MWALSPGGPRKGPKKFLKNYFMKKYVRIYYVGAAVKIGIVVRATTMVDSAILKY